MSLRKMSYTGRVIETEMPTKACHTGHSCFPLKIACTQRSVFFPSITTHLARFCRFSALKRFYSALISHLGFFLSLISSGTEALKLQTQKLQELEEHLGLWHLPCYFIFPWASLPVIGGRLLIKVDNIYPGNADWCFFFSYSCFSNPPLYYLLSVLRSWLRTHLGLFPSLNLAASTGVMWRGPWAFQILVLGYQFMQQPHWRSLPFLNIAFSQ